MLVDVKERKFPFQLLESRLLSVKLFQHLVSRFEVLIKRGRMGELGCHYFCYKGRKGRELKGIRTETFLVIHAIEGAFIMSHRFSEV